MRHIGNLPDEGLARRFEDYLLTQGIKSQTDPEEDGWAVWIFDEDQVDLARQELAAFRDDPGAAKYAEAKSAANEQRQAEIKEAAAAKRRQVDVRRHWQRPLYARAPVTVSLIMISIFVVLATTDFARGTGWRLCNKTDSFLKHLFFRPTVEKVDPKTGQTVEVYGEVVPALKRGEVHHLVTPIFIHFSVLHILFNMMWLRQLGGAAEGRYGWWKFLLIVLFIAITSNTGQHMYNIYEGRKGLFGGMSGVVFGLFGFIWMKSKYDPRSGLQMPQRLVVLMIVWMVLCYTGLFGSIANAAHTIGLIAGMILGCWPVSRRT